MICYRFILLLLIVTNATAQAPADTATSPANSFQKIYKKKIPALHYSYDQQKQTHDYSGNWDIDGDNKMDGVYFIGNGGAHLYYHLRVVLSIDKKARDFLFLLTDMPLLDADNLLERNLSENQLMPKFVVSDFNNDAKKDIYLNIGPLDSEIPENWKKKGLSSRHLVVTYEGTDLTIKNYASAVHGKSND